MNRDTIINKAFTRAFLGYDAGEVDSFLDEIVREFDRVKQELDVARLRNKMLLDELERFRNEEKAEKAAAAAQTAAAEEDNAATQPEGAADNANAAAEKAADTGADTPGANEKTADDASIKIECIRGYDDPRFDTETLRRRGAYSVNGTPCSIMITGADTATISWHGDINAADDIIEAFRLHAGQISKFYDEAGTLIKEYPPRETFEIEIESVQPSKFYINSAKLAAVETFVDNAELVAIPVLQGEKEGEYIAADGHTRLYCAKAKMGNTVRAYYAEENGALREFAAQAKQRGIHSVSDMQIITPEEYAQKWDAYCKAFLTARENAENCEQADAALPNNAEKQNH